MSRSVGHDEAARLASLFDYDILDTEAEQAFDRVTELAAELFDAPMALVTLIDRDRQWFKSRIGLDGTETPREHAFCNHALALEPGSVMVVEDATRDARFADNPFVTGDPSVRFYAGAVLTSSDGCNLGTLCVIDNRPRATPTERELKRLRILAKVVVDEMDLRRARRDAERQAQQLALAEHLAGVGNWRFDLVTGVISWSDELYRIHGVSPDTFDLTLESALAFFDPEGRAMIEQSLDDVRQGKPSHEFDLALTRPDGERRDVTCKGTLERDAQGRPAHLIGVFQDMTREKQQARALEEARAAAEATAVAKSEFLANMSHELRTPLTSIIGFAGLIGAQGGLPEESRRYLDRVEIASRALLGIVNDVLDFSKLEAGEVTLAPEPTDAAKLCRDTLDLFMPQAAAKDLALVLEAEAPPDGPVAVDPDRVRQILLNLISNAVKFSSGGEVRVTLRHDGDRLRVAVRDTGPGMSDEQQSRLFRRFSEVDSALQRSRGGSGLGLAICKGLVLTMQGCIGVESRLGAGSTFWFEIPAPLAQAPRAPSFVTAAGESRLAGVRVLVVDDHPANRELVRLFLSGVGAEVCEAVDGYEAVERASEWPVDVILMDLHMPGMDGDEACRAIRTGGGPNDRVAILAFTAGADEVDVRALGAGGFDGMVGKPIDAPALIASVAKAASYLEDDAPMSLSA